MTNTERYNRFIERIKWIAQIETEALSEVITTEIEGGFSNPLQDCAMIILALENIKAAGNILRSYALMDAQKFPKGLNTYKTVVFDVRDAGVRYDYAAFPEWNVAKENLKNIEEMLKPNAPKKATETVFFHQDMMRKLMRKKD
jgi:hypothetical protein